MHRMHQHTSAINDILFTHNALQLVQHERRDKRGQLALLVFALFKLLPADDTDTITRL